MDKTGS
jgi:hypothetical protein